jgi:hypothetical protein
MTEIPSSIRGLGAVEDGGDLGHPHPGHHPGGADGAGADAHLDHVGAGAGQGLDGLGGGHVARHDGQLGEGGAQGLHRLDDPAAVAVGGVDAHHIHPRFDQLGRPRDALGPHPHRGPRQQAALGVHHRTRPGGGLLQILDRDQPPQAPVGVHHQQLLDAVGMQQALAGREITGVFGGDQPGGHHLAHRPAEVVFKAQIAVGEDAHQPLVLHHREAVDAVAHHQGHRVAQGTVGLDDHRITHQSALGLLDPAHLVGLLGGLEVLVDEAQPPRPGHGDGGRSLGHGVHGRAHQRDAQHQAAAEVSASVYITRQDLGVGRLEQHIIEREPGAKAVVRHGGLLGGAGMVHGWGWGQGARFERAPVRKSTHGTRR